MTDMQILWETVRELQARVESLEHHQRLTTMGWKQADSQPESRIETHAVDLGRLTEELQALVAAECTAKQLAGDDDFQCEILRGASISNLHS